MTFTVQDDTGGVAGANAYITVDFFKTYHADRGNAYTAVDDAIQQAIIKATQYLDGRFRFRGLKLLGRYQTTEWPRSSALDADDQVVFGIPLEVQNATAEYALRALTGTLNPDPERDASGAAVAAKSETVGPISESTTFVGGAAFTLPKYPVADQMLRRAGLTLSGNDVLRA